MTDPAYETAVEELRKRQPRGVLMAHVRKASLGGAALENTHPFLIGDWSFCHNGTVWGFAPPHKNDSLALFEALHEDIRKRDDVAGAIGRLVDEVSCLDFTSLTFLLSDGETLYGFRKVGNVDEECRAGACDPEYYTLGIGKLAGQTVLSQEHEFLGLAGTPWRVVPDGHLAIVGPDGHARVQPLRPSERQ